MFLGIAAATGVVLFVVSQKDALVVTLVSRDIGRTSGINVRRLNLLYLEMFALTVALGLRFLGALLMGFTVLGTVLGRDIPRDTGPPIVTLSAAGFLINFLRRPQ